jgi:hypothetical protein
MLQGLTVQKDTKEKRSENIGVMVTPSVRALIEKIAKAEDRSLSWVAGKLLERGLEQFRRDGLLHAKGKAAGGNVE